MEAYDTAWSETRFNASGIIEVVLPIGVDLPLWTIEKAVFNADRLNPWRSGRADDEHDGIRWHDHPRLTAEGGGVDRLYHMEIRPFGLLRPPQLAAYHQYLMGIAREVAEMRLPNVVAVKARAIFSGVYGSHRIPPEERAT